MKFKAMYVHESRGEYYAHWITYRYKTEETRTKNTLLPLVGEIVAVICTRSNHKAEIIGFVDVTGYSFCPETLFEMYRPETMIPTTSKYNKFGYRNGKPGKWFYHLANGRPCMPFPVPDNAVKHGRAWCEFDLPAWFHINWL